MEIYCPGGGGVGPAFERDQAAVVEDVRNGVVTWERAQTEYGVIIDPVTCVVDEVATSQLRG